MPKTNLIAGSFDLQRRNKLCNNHGCGKLPSKRVTLYEENRITRNKKVLANVYLCRFHNETKIPVFLTEINKHRETGKLIGKKTHEMGLLTY